MHFDAVSVAAINATILAVGLGAATAYFLFIFQGLYAMTTEAIEIANRVNDFQWVFYVSSDISYDASDPDQRLEMAREIYALANPVGFKNRYNRANQLLSRMSLVVANYPFPAVPREVVEGGVKTGGPRRPISLTNVKEIATWADDAERLLADVSWSIRTHRSGLTELLRETDRTRNLEAPSDSPGVREDYERMFKEADPAQTIQDFLAEVNDVLMVARAAKAKLAQISRYRRRLPNRTSLLVGLALAGLVGSCGVVLPMVCPNTSVIVVAWIPGSIYLSALIGAIIWVARRYRREEIG